MTCRRPLLADRRLSNDGGPPKTDADFDVQPVKYSDWCRLSARLPGSVQRCDMARTPRILANTLYRSACTFGQDDLNPRLTWS